MKKECCRDVVGRENVRVTEIWRFADFGGIKQGAIVGVMTCPAVTTLCGLINGAIISST